MTALHPVAIVVGLLAGGLAGAAYFALLAGTLRLLLGGSAARGAAFGVLRFAALAGVLWLLARWDGQALIAAALGILAVRPLVLRRWRVPDA